MKEEISPIPVSQEELLDTAKEWDEKAKAHNELDEFGITQDFITGFESDITAAEGFKTADEVDKDTAVLTVQKNNKNKECYTWIKTALIHYGKLYPNRNSAERKLFPDDYTVARTNDTHTAAVMPTIIKLLTDNKAALMAKGMKADFIDKGAALLAGLNEVKLQHTKKMDDDELYTI